MTAARDLNAEAEHRTSQREALRKLLLTGRTFTNVELEKLMGGQRYGARLFELRNGKHGPALDIRKWRLTGSGSRWAYQCVGVLVAPEQLGTKESLRKRLAVVRNRLKRAHAEEAALLSQLGGAA